MGGHLQPWDGKSPLSIAAALLLLVTSLPRATQHPSAAAIAAASGVAEVRCAHHRQALVRLASAATSCCNELCILCNALNRAVQCPQQSRAS